MKCLILSLLLILPSFAFSQKADSLSQYSYLVISIKNKKPAKIQTGFLLKVKSKLFLVSSYHTFSSWDAYTNQRIYPICDTLEIRFKNKATGKNEFILFDIAKIEKSSKYRPYYEKGDFYMFELKNLYQFSKFEMNIINYDPTITNYKKLNPSKIIAFGFPNERLNIKNESDLFKIDPIGINGEIIGQIWQKWSFNDSKEIDSINYRSSIRGYGGYSGSPVFWKVIVKGKESFKFGGVVSGSSPDYKQLIICKPNNLTYK